MLVPLIVTAPLETRSQTTFSSVPFFPRCSARMSGANWDGGGRPGYHAVCLLSAATLRQPSKLVIEGHVAHSVSIHPVDYVVVQSGPCCFDSTNG